MAKYFAIYLISGFVCCFCTIIQGDSINLQVCISCIYKTWLDYCLYSISHSVGRAPVSSISGSTLISCCVAQPVCHCYLQHVCGQGLYKEWLAQCSYNLTHTVTAYTKSMSILCDIDVHVYYKLLCQKNINKLDIHI